MLPGPSSTQIIRGRFYDNMIRLSAVEKIIKTYPVVQYPETTVSSDIIATWTIWFWQDGLPAFNRHRQV